MSLFARLRARRQSRRIATLTDATDATDTHSEEPSVASVASVAVASLPRRNVDFSQAAANDTISTPAADPNIYCWPHSEAMNGQEVDIFAARTERFINRGVSNDDAERLADKLVVRDREGDERRLCLECSHLQGTGRWRCGNWQAGDVASNRLACDLVLMLQRCPGYTGLHDEP